jgi:hypothetical protein
MYNIIAATVSAAAISTLASWLKSTLFYKVWREVYCQKYLYLLPVLKSSFTKPNTVNTANWQVIYTNVVKIKDEEHEVSLKKPFTWFWFRSELCFDGLCDHDWIRDDWLVPPGERRQYFAWRHRFASMFNNYRLSMFHMGQSI